ncbi:TPA: hypothetical protein DDW35_08940 [Candidatus Sumerlaeota bacterium]|nr:hypothetical protein [Candidatus Sumerlaeota bacterium]
MLVTDEKLIHRDLAHEVVCKIFDSLPKKQENNTDYLRFPNITPPESKIRKAFMSPIRFLAGGWRKRLSTVSVPAVETSGKIEEDGVTVLPQHLPLKRYSTKVRKYASRFISLLPMMEDYQKAFDILTDECSKDWMVELLAYRVLGGKRVKLSANTEEFWEARRKADQLKVQENVCDCGRLGMGHVFDLTPVGIPIRVWSHPIYISVMVQGNLYRLKRGKIFCGVEPGDVVLDAGACWGETALMFASQAKEGGRVYSFEFDSANLKIFKQNLSMNPELSGQVQIVPAAVWSSSGEKIEFDSKGASTSLTNEVGGENSVTTICIDDFVREQGLERVNFIKMDIEGAELQALEGAIETIRRFRPKMALCLYHKPEDFYTIPLWLHNLNLGYRFSVDHNTIHAEETVLYAQV